MQHSEGFLKLVQDAKSRVKQVDYRDSQKTPRRRRKIDPSGHARRSRMGQWPRSRRDSPGQRHHRARHRKTIPDHDAPIVLYCGGGFRSALAADNLQKMGYTNVISMDGGWRGWTESGYPITKD